MRIDEFSTPLEIDGNFTATERTRFSCFGLDIIAVTTAPLKIRIDEFSTPLDIDGVFSTEERTRFLTFGFSKQLDIDYADQLTNDTTGKTLIFQIFNTASLYKKYTFTDCAITDLVENIIIDANFVEHPTYQCTMVPLTMVPEFKDGLNKTTFYNL